MGNNTSTSFTPGFSGTDKSLGRARRLSQSTMRVEVPLYVRENEAQEAKEKADNPSSGQSSSSSANTASRETGFMLDDTTLRKRTKKEETCLINDLTVFLQITPIKYLVSSDFPLQESFLKAVELCAPQLADLYVVYREMPRSALLQLIHEKATNDILQKIATKLVAITQKKSRGKQVLKHYRNNATRQTNSIIISF